VLRGSDAAARVVSQALPLDAASAGYGPGGVNGLGASQPDSDAGSLRSEVDRLKAEAERSAQEAFRRGKTEGERLARQAVDRHLEAEVGTLRQLMHEMKAVGPQGRRQTEEQLVRLSVSVARRILHRELTIDREALQGLIKAAFDKLEGRTIQRVRTDPQSAETIRLVMNRLGMSAAVRVVADPTLSRGSLLIDFPNGELDASVETQLAEIERGFVDIVRHS
jgi:flagellar assembly protein FliH